MSTFSSYPPIRHHSSQLISPSHAQQLLADFLKKTVTHPSLDPNALLTEDGPISRSTSTGLVLHNLRRVEAGLRGEHIAADLSFKNFGGEGLPKSVEDPIANGEGECVEIREEAGMNQEADWQDKDEYERQQTIEHGDVGLRSNVVKDPEVGQKTAKSEGEVPAVKGLSRAEKAERKRRKKEKREQTKRAREKELSGRHKG
ncbi:MAG: hypothetical protein L6R41_007002 [Letrouitia leprolyta]|nr:MAG: hypothetical protein L6R41_007002 [Letrouitia leprolyta]